MTSRLKDEEGLRLLNEVVLWLFFKTITGAMSTINPPVPLAETGNQYRLDFIQEFASQPDFDYPQVRQ